MADMTSILIIDDDYLVLQSFKNLLKVKGYKVQTAESYAKALELVEWCEFHLILSDIRMPEKNGVETVTDIHAKLSDVEKKPPPVIFMTGYADDATELLAEELGIVLYKPIDIDNLLEVIQDTLQG